MVIPNAIEKISILKIQYVLLSRSARSHLLVYELDDGTNAWFCPAVIGTSILLFSRKQCLSIIEKNNFELLQDITIDIDESFVLLSNKGVDSTSTILDTINIFDDFVKALKVDVSDVNMEVIDHAANYLTFNQDLNGIEDFDVFFNNYVRLVNKVIALMI